jgi:hypothetical protein
VTVLLETFDHFILLTKMVAQRLTREICQDGLEQRFVEFYYFILLSKERIEFVGHVGSFLQTLSSLLMA